MAEEDDMDNVDEIVDELIELVDENENADHEDLEEVEHEDVEEARILGMSRDEFYETFRKQWVRGILLMFFETGYHPLANSRHLTYLGYEPFPLFRTRQGFFGLHGPEVLCRPSIFYYTFYLYRKHGVEALYLGLDPHILGLFVERFFTFFAHKYIDFYYPDMGGKPLVLREDTKESDLTDMQSFRKRLRYFIRSITVSTANIVIVYPFTVMTMRHIAQFIYKQNIGGSIKYEHFFTTIWKIGHNEGPKGFYGGLIPAILGNFFYSAGFATTMFILSRIITRIKRAYRMQKDSIETKIMDFFGDLIKISAKFMLIHLTMPMKVVSWCMALKGSGLAIPTLPYSENNDSWEDVYGVVKNLPWIPTVRRWFHRTYDGPIRAQADFDGIKYYVDNNRFWYQPLEEDDWLL
uniref:Uncharacterized protein n=1 Tax=Acrobeloides nanus TaxID=290746 RepID=A0A914E2I7_9BILA